MNYDACDDLFHDPEVGPKLLELTDGSTWAKDLTEDDLRKLCKYLRL